MKPSPILIIGAGGVSNVTTHKCAQLPEIFGPITLASRTLSKCETIAASVKERTSQTIHTAQLNADDPAQTAQLIQHHQPKLILNLALPYQDLAIMDACLATGTHYLDTANYEPPHQAKFEYKWQWAYHERYRELGLTALLGSGFDPGVTGVFTAWAAKHHFSELHTLDIIDINGGDHGHPFATNFNPEINLREVTAPCRHWENGTFIETPPMSTHRTFTCPNGLGTYQIYRMYHEELESLTKHHPTLQRAQFWMSFSPNYLKHLEVLQNIGLTSIHPIPYQGRDIVPLQFLKALLPKPETLGPRTTGHTCIGNILTGLDKQGQPHALYIYNTCDHQACYREVGSQAISYTTGVPAMIGAKHILQDLQNQPAQTQWARPGVWNIEQHNPDPFMHDLNQHGLPWHTIPLTPTQAKHFELPQQNCPKTSQASEPAT